MDGKDLCTVEAAEMEADMLLTELDLSRPLLELFGVDVDVVVADVVAEIQSYKGSL